MRPPARILEESRAARAAEIVLVFLTALTVMFLGWRLVGDDPLARQAVVWVANVAMLAVIWAGLGLRGQSWADLGLSLSIPGWRRLLQVIGQSVVVVLVAVAAFLAGSVVTANVAPTPESADLSGYAYLQGDLPMLLLALAAVYVVSSFGEEAVYRGFLLNRVEEMGGRGMGALVTAVVASSVAFGLAHFDWGLVGVVQTTFMGLALAVSYHLVGRNLWVLVLAHAYLDTALLVQIYLGSGPGQGG